MLQGLLSSDSVRVDSDGLVDPGDVQSAITDATCLVSIMHSNNEVGSVQPISDITHIARQRNVLVHTDAAQSIGKVLLLCLSQAAENAACVSAVTYIAILHANNIVAPSAVICCARSYGAAKAAT